MTSNLRINGSKSGLLRRCVHLGILAMTGFVGIAGVSTGCLDRPVHRSDPETNNVFVTQFQNTKVDKIDLLFMIDNSLSMGDKQTVLADAVPQLLGRLVNPDCVDDPKNVTERVSVADPNADCPAGASGPLQREFAPVADIHIGVISSSLGDYGGDVCPEDGPQNVMQNDHGWLLGALPRTAETLGGQQFLAWTPADAAQGSVAIDTRSGQFGTFVQAAGELGCGLEMSLDSWYRFLVDPVPPTDVVHTELNPDGTEKLESNIGRATDPNTGEPLIDQNILAQRLAFLRPDSLLAVVMLSDENDCSLRDSGISWLAARAYQGANRVLLKPGTSACATDPNSSCCYTCYHYGTAGTPPPAGCPDESQACQTTLTEAEDTVGLRCWNQKRRFGYDFLFPIARYVNALTLPELCPDQTFGDLDCSCHGGAEGCAPGARKYANPLYVSLDENATGQPRANTDLIFLAGIVGVPWQDVATDQSLDPNAPLVYQRALDIDWGLILPDENGNGPTDPHMIETPDIRSGTNPRTGTAIAGADAAYMADTINGHDWNTGYEDLQFACIFDVTAVNDGDPRDCNITCGDTDEVCKRSARGCSCGPQDDPTNSHSPLCQNSAGNYGSLQYAAKAYPGVRELQVLQSYAKASVNANSIVASICPKSLTGDKNAAGYGYNPAVQALVDRLKEKLGGSCLPRALIPDPTTGDLPCAVIEALSPAAAANGYCDCAAHGRDPVDPKIADAVLGALEDYNLCGPDNVNGSCDQMCMCQLRQLPAGSTERERCLTEQNIEHTAASPGYCYIDPALGFGSPDLVAECPETQRRLLRFVGNEALGMAAPAPNANVFIACAGASYDPSLVSTGN